MRTRLFFAATLALPLLAAGCQSAAVPVTGIAVPDGPRRDNGGSYGSGNRTLQEDSTATQRTTTTTIVTKK
jgi:hypothetical protein